MYFIIRAKVNRIIEITKFYAHFQRLFVFTPKNTYLCSKTKMGKVIMNNLIKILNYRLKTHFAVNKSNVIILDWV